MTFVARYQFCNVRVRNVLMNFLIVYTQGVGEVTRARAIQLFIWCSLMSACFIILADSVIIDSVRWHFFMLKNLPDWRDHMDFLYAKKAICMNDWETIESSPEDDRVISCDVKYIP